MLLITYIQLSLFGKTSWERFLQMTGWTLEPSYPPSRTPKFQCLLREDGETPEWCEGERLMCAGGSWTPSIGQAPEGWHEGSGFSSWRILEADVPQTYYLSPVQCSHFLRLAERAGGPPPKEIEQLLLKQGGRYCWVSVKQFSKNDTATACQDWLRSTRLGRGGIKSHVRTVKVLGMGLFAFQERIHLWKGVTH